MVAISLEQSVRRRAGARCEYCRLPELAGQLRHTVDHIVARQHQGDDSLANLSLCCLRCNLHKGPNLSGIDPVTRRLTRLCHPRQDSWADHFRYDGPVLVGLTPVGRTTVDVLAINDPPRVQGRTGNLASGLGFD